ncbi:hypothetical protein [Telluribacter humicola]|uniref:hypothetical protein n=1 Tax=Telluribacter humicola TaxID=1720261 RepID=UPI001A96065D|nr:hypothetical protein [Telluribacter humicola]
MKRKRPRFFRRLIQRERGRIRKIYFRFCVQFERDLFSEEPVLAQVSYRTLYKVYQVRWHLLCEKIRQAGRFRFLLPDPNAFLREYYPQA